MAIPASRGLAEDRLTKTAGGAAALRARMMRPWSSAERIREVQESLRYIIARTAQGEW